MMNQGDVVNIRWKTRTLPLLKSIGERGYIQLVFITPGRQKDDSYYDIATRPKFLPKKTAANKSTTTTSQTNASSKQTPTNNNNNSSNQNDDDNAKINLIETSSCIFFFLHFIFLTEKNNHIYF